MQPIKKILTGIFIVIVFRNGVKFKILLSKVGKDYVYYKQQPKRIHGK